MLCCTCGDGGLVTRVKADLWTDNKLKMCLCVQIHLFVLLPLQSSNLYNSSFVIASFSHTQQGWFTFREMGDAGLTLQHNRRRTSGHYTAGFCSINPGVQSLSAARGWGLAQTVGTDPEAPRPRTSHWPGTRVTRACAISPMTAGHLMSPRS